jgi:tRNA/tmRNA/rRNA uracil-C5-methylase (TrmA/RlmC/RlmD family)
LSVLSVLSLSTARADLALAQKQAQVQQQLWQLESQAQQWLCEVETAVRTGSSLPADTQQAENLLCITLTNENRSLYVAVDKESLKVYTWQHQTVWAESPAQETLWGND